MDIHVVAKLLQAIELYQNILHMIYYTVFLFWGSLKKIWFWASAWENMHFLSDNKA